MAPRPTARAARDSVRVLDLEVPLAPLLGLDRREDRGAGGGEARVLGVDVVDDQHHQDALGGAAGAVAWLERGQAGPEIDDVEANVRAAEGYEAVGCHIAPEAKGLLEEAG